MTGRAWAVPAPLRGIGPGFLVSAVIAGAASLVAFYTGGPVMLFALVIGMAMNFVGKVKACQPGIAFASRFVLRVGVALLGFKITLGDVVGLGWGPVLLVIAAVSLTTLISVPAARWLGFDSRFGILSGGATAICGASAAMAISAALPNHPRREQATLFTVVGVSTLSTIVMLLYPPFVRLLGLDDLHAGIFIGGSVHDVAQVVGAGYAVSTEAGDTATIVKLARVAMLLPVILAVGLFIRSDEHVTAKDRPPLLPWFAVAFAVLVVLNSLLPVPELVRDVGNSVSRFCLIASIAALGIKSRFKDIAAEGWRPVLLMILQTVLIAGIVLVPIQVGWI